MMRLGEAAKALGIHPDTLRRLEQQGKFAPQRDWRGHRRVSEAELAHLRSILYPQSALQEKQETKAGV